MAVLNTQSGQEVTGVLSRCPCKRAAVDLESPILENRGTQIGDSRRMPFKTFKNQVSSKTRSTSEVGKCWKYVKSVTPILRPFRLFRSILGLLRIHNMDQDGYPSTLRDTPFSYH